MNAVRLVVVRYWLRVIVRAWMDSCSFLNLSRKKAIISIAGISLIVFFIAFWMGEGPEAFTRVRTFLIAVGANVGVFLAVLIPFMLRTPWLIQSESEAKIEAMQVRLDQEAVQAKRDRDATQARLDQMETKFAALQADQQERRKTSWHLAKYFVDGRNLRRQIIESDDGTTADDWKTALSVWHDDVVRFVTEALGHGEAIHFSDALPQGDHVPEMKSKSTRRAKVELVLLIDVHLDRLAEVCRPL